MRIIIHRRIYLQIFEEKYGVTESAIKSKSRKNNIFYCRLILCHFLKNEGVKSCHIAKWIQNTKGAVTYFNKKYHSDYQYTNDFKRMVLSVERIKKQKLHLWRKEMMKNLWEKKHRNLIYYKQNLKS